MDAVTIKVHPLSARVLASHYGKGAIGPFPRTDAIFDILASDTMANPADCKTYTERVTFIINTPYATRLNQYPLVAAMRLFRYHKTLLCWYVQACQQSCKMPMKTAIRQWLDLHLITEDDFNSETAYKVVQRFFWKKEIKTPLFFGRLKNHPAGGLGKTKREVLPPEHLDIALGEVLARYATIYQRVPKKLEQQLRIYIWCEMAHDSHHAVAAATKRPRSSVSYCVRTVRKKLSKTPALARIVSDVLSAALLQPA